MMKTAREVEALSKSAKHQIGKGNEVLLQRPNIYRVRKRDDRFPEMIVTVHNRGDQLTIHARTYPLEW